MKKSKRRIRESISLLKRLGRFLFKSQLLTIFLVLFALGFLVGSQTRPSPNVVPYAELFDHMSVASYRESPSDTTARFVVQLAAGGRVFSEYDVDVRRFTPPARDRGYSRAITGTHYRPIQVRGHVTQGLWLEVPRSRGRSLLPEQFDELYRATLDFVKPVSLVAGALGTLSGYSVGYRLGVWNGSLSSGAVQQRVLATPGLGRVIAREAWRRVLLEPALMGDEDDAARFAAVRTTQRLYANFFRLALNDSDGFIPREAERLARLGRTEDSRVMLAFAESVRRAALDSLDLAGTDFAAVERWAGLLVRRGHWATNTIPAAGAERVQYLGTLAWYGLAPPLPEPERVWVGPRLLVREGELEGFVADEITASGVGCPIAWRARLHEENNGATAMTNAWLADRPEFTALAVLGRRVAGGVARVSRQMAARQPARPGRPPRRALVVPDATPVAYASRINDAPAPAAADSAPLRATEYPFHWMGTDASVFLVTTDSAGSAPRVRAAQAALARLDSVAGDAVETRSAQALDAAAGTLRALGVRDALVEISGGAVALGAPAHSQHWDVGIRDRREPLACFARLHLGPGQAVSTSGEYEQFVITGGTSPAREPSPSGARAAGRLIAATALAPSAMAADSASAALLALPPDEAKRVARERADISAILIEPGSDGVDTVWVEADLRGGFVFVGDCGGRYRVEFF